MSREVWATFAVNDHCAPHAFLADVMLYDRLVIPVPPPRPTPSEQALWETWDWRRQEELLSILGDRAKTVPWDQSRQASWKTRFEAAKHVSGETGPEAFQMTRMELTVGLPPSVTAVESVSSYPSYDEMKQSLAITTTEGQALLAAGAVTAVLGREFLVADDPRMSEFDALAEAVAISSDSVYRRHRANYWRWQREFLNYEVFTDEKGLEAASEEMEALIEEQNAAVRKEKIRTVARYAFLVGSVSIGFFSGSMIPIALSPLALTLDKAFLSIGQFASERVLDPGPGGDRQAAALFCDFRKHFGWKNRS